MDKNEKDPPAADETAKNPDRKGGSSLPAPASPGTTEELVAFVKLQQFAEGRRKTLQRLLDRREKLEGLRPTELHLPPAATLRHPLMREIEKLYQGNLIPDEAFYYFAQGASDDYREAMGRGGMLNRFQPSAVEIQQYPPGYESVAMQVLHDLTCRSPRPGRYRMHGLRDPEGKLVSSLSYRLPPIIPKKMDKYRTYLAGIFDRVSFTGGIFKPSDLRGKYTRMMEIDTINARSDISGLGTKQLADTLQFIQETEGDNAPHWVFCYNFSGLELVSPTHVAREELLDIAPWENESASFLQGCGFNSIGHMKKEDELVIRAVGNLGEPVKIRPIWNYRIARFDRALEVSKRRLQAIMGVIDETTEKGPRGGAGTRE